MNKQIPLGKITALIAYTTFIGLIIAYFLNKDDKHTFAQWHIKNMFGLLILLFTSVALQDYTIGLYMYWISVGLWILSFIMALNNKQKAIPYLSDKFQTWFSFLD